MIPTKFPTIFCSLVYDAKRLEWNCYQKYSILKTKPQLIPESKFYNLTSLTLNEAIRKYYPEYLI